jgi:hypothetical protein
LLFVGCLIAVCLLLLNSCAVERYEGQQGEEVKREGGKMCETGGEKKPREGKASETEEERGDEMTHVQQLLLLWLLLL